MPQKSVLGLSERHASVLAYAGIFISGLLILIFERESKIVRFHALQSTVFFIALLVVSTTITWLTGWIWIIGGLIGSAVSLINAVLWLYMLLRVYFDNTNYKLPIIGEIAWRQVHK